MMLRLKGLLAIIVVGILVTLALPYFAWVDYDPEMVVIEGDPEPWTYPYDRGFAFAISWSASTWLEQGVIKGSMQLTVTMHRFDILDWTPESAMISVETAGPSYWEFFMDYYGFEAASIYPEDTLVVVLVLAYFTDSEGKLSILKVLDSDRGFFRYPFSELGDYSDSYTAHTRLMTGTLKWSATVSKETIPGSGIFNTNFASDYETFSLINPYEAG